MTDKKQGSCPICKKTSVKEYKPFCCKHCADVDLGKWLGERYVIEGDEPATINEMDGEDSD